MEPRQYIYVSERQDPNCAFPNGYTSSRPCFNVVVSHGEFATEEITTIVDSGADYCTFSTKLLPNLGLSKDQLKIAPAKGFGGNFDLWFGWVKIRVQDLGEWEVYAGFTDAEFPAVLGHSGFFDRYLVMLDTKGGMFSVGELPE